MSLIKYHWPDCWCRKSGSDVCCWADFWGWWQENEASFGFPSVKSHSRNCCLGVSDIFCSSFIPSRHQSCSNLLWSFCREITREHRRLAEIIEMIHTASLIHDDVLDESDMRRGNLLVQNCSIIFVNSKSSYTNETKETKFKIGSNILTSSRWYVSSDTI